MTMLPVLYIGNGSLVAGVESHLGRDIDNHQWAKSYRGRDIADRRAVVIFVCRRAKLSADMVHRQLVGRDRHALLFVGERLPVADDTGDGDVRQRWSYFEVRKSFADRSAGCDGVRQVDVFGILESRVVKIPKRHRFTALVLSERLPAGGNELRPNDKPWNDPTHDLSCISSHGDKRIGGIMQPCSKVPFNVSPSVPV